MAYMLFIDECGVDRRSVPYEVLAGIAVHDRSLWTLIQQVRRFEEEYFGRRISVSRNELKGKRLLKRKTFKHAQQLPEFTATDRRQLALSCLEKGDAAKKAAEANSSITQQELAAYAQAKIAFVGAILDACKGLDIVAIAAMVPKNSPQVPFDARLRNDYETLFDRFFDLLVRKGEAEQGLLVLDEVDRTGCHQLVEQMHDYFSGTTIGEQRAERIIPEPFFVHSDLTSAIQIADIVAYVIGWAVRVSGMEAERREELDELAEKVQALSFEGEGGQPSLVLLDSL